MRSTKDSYQVFSLHSIIKCLRSKKHDCKKTRKMEKEVHDIHHHFEKAIKILLLGTAESGKTTIIKQMKILHIDGFTDR